MPGSESSLHGVRWSAQVEAGKRGRGAESNRPEGLSVYFASICGTNRQVLFFLSLGGGAKMIRYLSGNGTSLMVALALDSEGNAIGSLRFNLKVCCLKSCENCQLQIQSDLSWEVSFSFSFLLIIYTYVYLFIFLFIF